MMTVGSLFAGIGGFDLGFERAGFKTLWQVEIDSYCTKVLEKNFPHAERFGDIRQCGSHNLRPVDVVTGGFPCQDISNAGLRAGIDGARSGLWGEMFRIVSELRPRVIVVENVAALLGRGIGRVLGDLSEIGYDAEWQVISAADVGAPHLRERVWIVAYPRREGQPTGRFRRGIAAQGKVFDLGTADGRAGRDVANADGEGSPQFSQGNAGSERGERRHAAGGCSGAPAHAESKGLEGPESARHPRPNGFTGEWGSGRRYSDWWATEPELGRVAHGIPHRVDRLKGLGNAIVPQIAELIARRLIEVQR